MSDNQTPNTQPDVARYGDWVDIEYTSPTGSTRRVHLVPPATKGTPLKDGDVSTSSPLGSTLFSKKAGDTFTIATPRGPRTIRIKHISHQL